MLRIAIQTKGRLNEESIQLLKDADIKLSDSRRKLLSPSTNFPVEILYLRDDDIPQSVADGVADIGIVGENEWLEKGSPCNIIEKLNFSKCRLSLAIPKDAKYENLQWFNGKKIATSYPNILNKFLVKNNIKAEIHEISGSVEIAPSINLSDAIFDIVSSGSTLVSNNLKEVDVVLNSEAVLIGNPEKLNDLKKEILKELQFRIESVMRTASKKYILMNAPNENIEKISKLLPSTKSPTVMPLAAEGWSSVHSVIDVKTFWKIIGKLKELKAEGILIIPIEKMIL